MTVLRTLAGVLILTYVLLSTQCKHEPDYIFENIIIPEDTVQIQTCDSDTIYFQNDVLPLLISSCANTGCHDANYRPMPKNGQKLSDCKITEIKIWIEDGTPNN